MRCRCLPDNPCQARLDWREAMELGYPRWSMMTRSMADANSPLTYDDFEQRRMAFRAAHMG